MAPMAGRCSIAFLPSLTQVNSDRPRLITSSVAWPGRSERCLDGRPDGSDEALVLKVALDATQDEPIRAEGELLASLHHPNIIEYRGPRQVSSRTAILTTTAGEKTLAKRFKESAPISLYSTESSQNNPRRLCRFLRLRRTPSSPVVRRP
jgi:hypothetical protein